MLSLSRILQHWCVNWTLKVLLVLGMLTGHVCPDSHPGLHLKLVAIAGLGSRGCSLAHFQLGLHCHTT